MMRTGRPREFDRDHAIESAMKLFWSQGYEPTSLSQLKSAWVIFRLRASM